jgi:hypothetical protein
MLTEEMVDELVERFNGFNRDGVHGVLKYLNSAHEILMTQEAQQNLVFDTATGQLPAINTTTSTFNYVMPDTIWRVSSVLIDGEKEMLPQYDYHFNRMQRSSYKNSTVVAGRVYTRIPFVRTWDYINSNSLCHIMFTRDPEDKTDFYFRESYRRPTQILSESIQVDIQPPWDYNVLLPAAAKLIEGVLNGDYVEARQYVENVLKKDMWKQLDGGDQGYLDEEPVSRDF